MIGERFRLEFRGEIFNLFNHSQFFQPDGNVTDGSDFRPRQARARSALDPVRLEVLF